MQRHQPRLVPVSYAVRTLSCADRVGMVHAVSGLLAEHRCDIVDSWQFGDEAPACP